jgi:hypothetical protein
MFLGRIHIRELMDAGSPGGIWNLLTSTNVALSMSSWTINLSGNFDGLGNLTLTNEINSTEPQRFLVT